MKLFCVLVILFLAGCGDRYSLDEKRGPDPKGFVTTHPLSLPPDYLLRAPEPATAEKTQEKEETKVPEEKKDVSKQDGQTGTADNAEAAKETSQTEKTDAPANSAGEPVASEEKTEN